MKHSTRETRRTTIREELPSKQLSEASRKPAERNQSERCRGEQWQRWIECDFCHISSHNPARCEIAFTCTLAARPLTSGVSTQSPQPYFLINQHKLIISYRLAVRLPQPIKPGSRVHTVSKCRRAMSNPHLIGNTEAFSNALCVYVRHATPSWVITYFPHNVAAWWVTSCCACFQSCAWESQ